MKAACEVLSNAYPSLLISKALVLLATGTVKVNSMIIKLLESRDTRVAKASMPPPQSNFNVKEVSIIVTGLSNLTNKGMTSPGYKIVVALSLIVCTPYVVSRAGGVVSIVI